MNKVPPLAVILAAGMGTRLGEQGQLAPKGFLQFGEDGPIIERSLAQMQDAGVERVVIVTGHLQHFYQELAARMPGLIELVHNPLYAESGSMYSLHTARERLTETFWLFESDLVYERKALDELARVHSGSALLLSGPTGSMDEVYAEASGDLLVNLSKDRSQLGANVLGELVGISRIEPDCFARMVSHSEQVFASTLKLEYEQALVGAARGGPVRCQLVEDLAWSEVDTEAHWQRVNDRVYPEILRRDAAHATGVR
ncbi:2-C-methyl-D-erythritol 4-phosphate cytidylyltransferase [Andreprevotia sp. IGB-42]|uniref:phosphocholine cytidylyltransferase family protein n=1 Tax=Andreprevotia sp. IGB-42 TaxID=2497473 RepID=UPI00135C1B9B|nr:phosphocholine cytidylyltransferase family protein [Andreprevotia sp. IGB-42]KAF0815043.1 2-C-methyl-D-erythritol 4-phosphate cytidylyltransferase [Andreprevotia sp. IGB-42]